MVYQNLVNCCATVLSVLLLFFFFAIFFGGGLGGGGRLIGGGRGLGGRSSGSGGLRVRADFRFVLHLSEYGLHLLEFFLSSLQFEFPLPLVIEIRYLDLLKEMGLFPSNDIREGDVQLLIGLEALIDILKVLSAAKVLCDGNRRLDVQYKMIPSYTTHNK